MSRISFVGVLILLVMGLFLLMQFPFLLPAAFGAEVTAKEDPPASLLVDAAAGEEAAITELRALGPAGLEAILASDAPDFVVDAVAAQKYARYSQLYWHTDWEAAQAAAKQSGRPILSLRLLGSLDEDFSCANSRLFRVLLYPDPAVSELMREKFVLHWQSVRPVPVVTIDFGDGRTLRRTITGNSLHLVCTPDGRPIDVMPGLVSPSSFVGWLESAINLEARVRGLSPDVQASALANLHAVNALPAGSQVRTDSTPPTAAQAAPLAMSKSVIEVPVVRRLSPEGPVLAEARMQAGQRAVPAGANAVAFSDQSLALMRSLWPANDEAAFEAAVARLGEQVARDTWLNQAQLRPAVRRWFANRDATTTDADALVEKIYAEIFLTPSSNPWLGLAPPDAFAALPEQGLSAAD